MKSGGMSLERALFYARFLSPWCEHRNLKNTFMIVKAKYGRIKAQLRKPPSKFSHLQPNIALNRI